jgi:hypothetical protein
MLFQEYKYFQHKFPEPQYLGTKHVHLSWISKVMPENTEMVFNNLKL